MYDYSAPPQLLAGQVILITGAGRGIGAAVAQSAADLGATLILLGRSEANLNEVGQRIETAGHPRPTTLVFDLQSAEPRDYHSLADQLQASHGRLDGLLHNASIIGPRTALKAIDGAEFMSVMQVNVNATFLLTQALLPLLEQAPAASVVFTSSSVGRKGRAHWGAYGVSKFATEGLMQTLADEFAGTPARSNSVNPGATRTDMRALAYPDENPARNPWPADIMPVYLYLLGPDSQGVNGQALDAQ
jgi:NAD(P)-dependent dehydrogenase (short-subunit alcohol dehydrogenase family)